MATVALIAALGPPAAAVVVFEVLLNGLAVFNHANVRMNERVDGCLRWLIVTPDMHRIHHSWHTAEHNRNFGFNLTWWDRLFGTYLAQPRDGQHAMTLGLPVFRAPEWRRLAVLDDPGGALAQLQAPGAPRPARLDRVRAQGQQRSAREPEAKVLGRHVFDGVGLVEDDRVVAGKDPEAVFSSARAQR